MVFRILSLHIHEIIIVIKTLWKRTGQYLHSVHCHNVMTLFQLTSGKFIWYGISIRCDNFPYKYSYCLTCISFFFLFSFAMFQNFFLRIAWAVNCDKCSFSFLLVNLCRSIIVHIFILNFLSQFLFVLFWKPEKSYKIRKFSEIP